MSATMRAVVLAAGFGTRLRPLSLELPKPAWPLFDIPLAAHVLNDLHLAGAGEAIVNLHHLPERMQGALEPWVPRGMNVSWSPEQEILGTGGALLPWREVLDSGVFFLANGDTYQETDLQAMVSRHRETGALATLTLRAVDTGAPAPIEVDYSGRIVRFLGGRLPGGGRGTPCEFTGIHVLDPEILAHLPDRPHCINADVHQELVARGAPLYGFLQPREGFWSDLGTPARYLEAHRELLRRRALPARCPGRVFLASGPGPGGGWIEAPAYLGPGAQVEPGCVAGPFAILGRNARLEDAARFRDGVLWSGARLSGGTWRDLIVSDSGQSLPVEAQEQRE